MTYDELSIHEKLNLKAALREWATYAVAHFGQELDKKVYGVRTNRAGYQYSRIKRVSGRLRRTWYQNVTDSGGVDRVMIQFLQYGRFLDMGVGQGVTHTSRIVNRQLRLGSTGRSRKPWYAKRKGYETHRLRELLAEKNINLAMGTIESVLNLTVALNL